MFIPHYLQLNDLVKQSLHRILAHLLQHDIDVELDRIIDYGLHIRLHDKRAQGPAGGALALYYNRAHEFTSVVVTGRKTPLAKSACQLLDAFLPLLRGQIIMPALW